MSKYKMEISGPRHTVEIVALTRESEESTPDVRFRVCMPLDPASEFAVPVSVSFYMLRKRLAMVGATMPNKRVRVVERMMMDFINEAVAKGGFHAERYEPAPSEPDRDQVSGKANA